MRWPSSLFREEPFYQKFQRQKGMSHVSILGEYFTLYLPLSKTDVPTSWAHICPSLLGEKHIRTKLKFIVTSLCQVYSNLRHNLKC